MKAFGRIGCSAMIFMAFLASAVRAEQKPAANAAKGPEGTWKGTINAGGQELRLVVRISKKDDGSLTGKLDSPDQGANDMPIEDVSWKDGKFRFELKVVKASYEGQVNESGSEVTGDWKQSGQTIPVTFKREK